MTPIHYIKCTLPFLVILFSCNTRVAVGFEQEVLGKYSFELVASTNQEIQYLSSPRINDKGAVAFVAHMNGATSVYYSDGGPLQQVVGTGYRYGGGRFNVINSNIDMNNHGVIAFSTSHVGEPLSAVYGVFTISLDGMLTRVSQNDLTKYFFCSGVSINDIGDVAYLGSAPSYEDVYLTTSSFQGIIFRGGDYHQSPSPPEINGSGVVAFAGNTSSAGSPEDMFIFANGQVTKVDSTQPGRITKHMTKPGLNNFGEIAYARETAADSFELISYKDGFPNVLPVAGVWDAGIQLSDKGAIAFYGVNGGGFNGVRVYDHGLATDVLGFGDTIFGKQAQIVEAWDINESV